MCAIFTWESNNYGYYTEARLVSTNCVQRKEGITPLSRCQIMLGKANVSAEQKAQRKVKTLLLAPNMSSKRRATATTRK